MEPTGAGASPPLRGQERGRAPVSLHAVLPCVPSASAARQARRFISRTCEQWAIGPGAVRPPQASAADAAVHIGSELVANAVRHAGTGLELHLDRAPTSLVIAVHDYGRALPASAWGRGSPARGAEVDLRQRGLRVVRGLASTVGSYPHPAGGKVVWATVDLEPPGPAGGLEAAPDRVTATVPRRAADGPSCGVSRRRPLPTWGGGVSERIVVNGRRRMSTRPVARWRVEVVLNWQPQDPASVSVTVTSSPPHPGLPYGCWTLPRAALQRGLEATTAVGAVVVLPDPSRDVVLLELTDLARPTTVSLPLVRVRRFLLQTAASGEPVRRA